MPCRKYLGKQVYLTLKVSWNYALLQPRRTSTASFGYFASARGQFCHDHCARVG
jgi:hypothetical protein